MEGGTASMSSIITAMGDAFGMVSTVVTEITENPVLLFLFAASLIPVGIAIFRKLKKAAR